MANHKVHLKESAPFDTGAYGKKGAGAAENTAPFNCGLARNLLRHSWAAVDRGDRAVPKRDSRAQATRVRAPGT